MEKKQNPSDWSEGDLVRVLTEVYGVRVTSRSILPAPAYVANGEPHWRLSTMTTWFTVLRHTRTLPLPGQAWTWDPSLAAWLRKQSDWLQGLCGAAQP